MGKLIHKKKEVLTQMKIARTTFEISKGLMFSSKKKCGMGMCLIMPVDDDVKFGASVTMFFCLHPLEIIFVNSKFEVVDKKTLKTWVPTYVPKKACKYIIEAYPGRLKDIKIGDNVEIIF